MAEKGDIIRIISDNENYDRFRNQNWIITRIDRNDEDNPFYDSTVGGQLVSCRGLPFSLYEYEFEIVGHKAKPRISKNLKRKLKKVV